MRELKRKFFPYSPLIDEWALEQGIRQIEMLSSEGCSPDGKIVLELGTGWKPVIPILFFLSGSKRLILVDRQRLLDRNLMLGVLNNLLLHKAKLSSRLGIQVEDIESRLRIGVNRSFNEILGHFNMEYLAPYNILGTILPEQSVDIIITRAVLEHIPSKTIKEIHRIFKRVLKDDGKICHVIDNSDHWEHGDKSISRLNFLRFSDHVFKLICMFNPLDYQNRLRHFEYIELLNESGFKVVCDRSQVDEEALYDLRSIKICKRYRRIPFEKLAILTSYIIASKR